MSKSRLIQNTVNLDKLLFESIGDESNLLYNVFQTLVDKSNNFTKPPKKLFYDIERDAFLNALSNVKISNPAMVESLKALDILYKYLK